MLDLNAVEDDEEYKKKLERARLLRNSFGMITSKDEEINNTTTNNNTYSTKEISDYQDKLEKARKLRNSFGMTTLKDIELENEVSNYISDNQNTYPQTVQNNNISQVQNTQQTNDSSNMPVTTNVDFYKLAQSGNMYKEQITENSSNIQKINILDTPIVSKKDPRVQSNLGYLKYGQKTRQDYENMKQLNDALVEKESEKINEKIKNGNYVGAFFEVVGKNTYGGMSQSIFGLINTINTANMFLARGSAVLSRLTGNDEVADRLDKKYNEFKAEGSYLNSSANIFSDTTSKIENNFIRTSGQVAGTISRQATDFGIGGSFGVSGSTVQGLGVAGSSSQEVLDEGGNIIQAVTTGGIKGYASKKIEDFFDANILTKGFSKSSIEKQTTKLISNIFKSKMGREIANKAIGVAGENIEEFVEDNFDYVIDYLINNKELPSFEKWWNNTTETAKITTISTILMQLLGFGGESFENKKVDLDNDAEFWAYETQKFIDKGGYALQYNLNYTLNKADRGTFYTTTFSKDGNIEGINAVQGKAIDNPNKRTNVSPVIVKNMSTDSYNVIDENTGVVLDSTPYNTLIQAQAEFNHKMINLDEATVKGINSKVVQANMAINNKMNEVISQAEGKLSDMSQTVQNNRTQTLNNETTNYTVKEQNNVISQNRTSEDDVINNTDISTTNQSNVNNIQNDVQNFSKQVDDVINNSFPRNDMLTLLSKTPQPLIDIGLTDLPITMTQKHLNTIMNSIGSDKNANYHGLGIDIVKQLPEAINNPLDIVESNTKNDSVVLTTYLADNQDKTIVASIKIDGKGQINNVEIDTNVMTSAYGKDNYEKFMNENLKNGRLLYDIDRGVIKKVDMARFQLPRHTNSTTTNSSSISNSIPQTNKVVKGTNTKSMQYDENNTSDNVQNGIRANSNNEAISYSSQEENGVTSQNRTYQNLSDEEIINIVKYNQDGKEIKDENYVDFMVDRYKDNQNISGIETDTDNIKNLLDETYQEAKKLIGVDNENKIRNKQKDLMITRLMNNINEQNFKTTVNLKNQKGQYVNTLLDIEISKKGLKESFNKSISNEKYAVVPFLDELIKTSQDGIIRDEAKLRDNIDEWYYLYNTAKVDGELYGIKIDIKKTGQGDKFYVHRLNIIKEGSLSSESIVKDNTIENTKMPSTDTSITQSNNKVKSSTNTKSMQNIQNNTQSEIRSMKKSASNKTNTKTSIMNNYDNITANRIKMSNRNVIVENNKHLSNLIDEALTTNENKSLHLGKLNENIINNIKSKIQNLPKSKENFLAKDTYDLVINQSEIRHLLDDKNALTNEDINNFIKILPDIISNSDYISYTNNLKNEGLRFKKLMPDGTYVSFVVVSNKQGTMKVKTIYMEKGDYQNRKRSISLTTDVETTPDNTSKTNRAFASNTSISQNNENVKTEQTKQINKPEAGLTNAERADAWIEKEIKIVEQTSSWDNTIPVTKRTDIRKTIEDYLGIGVGKGRFRERAYAIYNTKRDTIRSRELKDIDSILHETGHALDLGNRINIDKESISDELLAAIDKLGGYENETRAIRLDEGFAEIIREYAIVPNQAKADFPQTVAVIEGIRQNDSSFNNFIGRIQQQTYNYIHQNPRNRILGNQSIGEQTDKQQWTPERIKQEVMRIVYDKDYALKDIVNKMNTGNLKASDNAYLLTRLSSGIGQKVTSMLSNGYIDESGKKLFPGLSQLGEILGNDAERFNDLRAYLVAKRDMDYKAKTLKTGIRSMDSKAVVEQFKDDVQIQQAAQIVYDTLDGVLQYAVNNGLITQETANSLKESNAFYVPMHRVLDNKGNQVGRRGAVKNIVKQRTGSELDVKDVLENIIANSANIIQQVENNNVLKALYNEGEAYGLTGSIYDVISQPMQKVGTATLATWENELKNQGVDIDNIDFEKTIDIFAPNNKIDIENHITSFIDNNGKRVYLQFKNDVVFNSLMNTDKKFMSSVLKINSKLNLPLRYGATMANIGFAIPNMISDTAQATIYSTAGFIPVIDNALGVLDILATTNKTVGKFVKQVAPQYAERINNLYSLYEQSGATSATRLSQYRDSTQSIMKDVYGTKNSEVLGIDEKFKPLKRLLDLMTYIPELSEQSTRFRVFEKNYDYYKNKGNSETDARIMAAIESRDATQDFGRTGNFTREINQLIPFSAARVGSAYTFAEKVKANPKQVGMRIAILTALAMAIKGIGYDDDEIEELNQRKKDDNFVLKVGDTVVTIKKPQGILRSMINLAEYIQDLATGHIEEGKEGEKLGEWINNAIMDNMPADSITGLVPNAVAPLIENAINKDFYYNTDIVKSYDLDLPDSQQYYEYNSQLAILLGKIFNYSPAKIDNLISGYFGGLGTQTTNIMDNVMGGLGLIAEKPNMGAEDNAIGKRFVVNVNENSSSVDEIYNRKTELTKKKNGGTITNEETEELERITEAISNMSAINKQIKSIKADLTMSGDEKAEAIRPLQQQKTDTARQALGKDLIYSQNEQKIKSTKFYPSRNTLSQSGYTLNLDENMKKEYESLAYSYYSKYEKQGIYSKDKLDTIESKAKEYAKKTLIQKYKNKLTKSK